MAEQSFLPHKLTLTERSNLTLTGVTEVISFDDTAVILKTEEQSGMNNRPSGSATGNRFSHPGRSLNGAISVSAPGPRIEKHQDRKDFQPPCQHIEAENDR